MIFIRKDKGMVAESDATKCEEKVGNIIESVVTAKMDERAIAKNLIGIMIDRKKNILSVRRELTRLNFLDNPEFNEANIREALRCQVAKIHDYIQDSMKIANLSFNKLNSRDTTFYMDYSSNERYMFPIKDSLKASASSLPPLAVSEFEKAIGDEKALDRIIEHGFENSATQSHYKLVGRHMKDMGVDYPTYNLAFKKFLASNTLEEFAVPIMNDESYKEYLEEWNFLDSKLIDKASGGGIVEALMSRMSLANSYEGKDTPVGYTPIVNYDFMIPSQDIKVETLDDMLKVEVFAYLPLYAIGKFKKEYPLGSLFSLRYGDPNQEVVRMRKSMNEVKNVYMQMFKEIDKFEEETMSRIDTRTLSLILEDLYKLVDFLSIMNSSLLTFMEVYDIAIVYHRECISKYLAMMLDIKERAVM